MSDKQFDGRRAGNTLEDSRGLPLQKSKQSLGRRQFLTDMLRYVGLIILGWMATFGLRGGSKRLPGQSCVNRGICTGCGSADTCGLPQALSMRQTQRDSSDTEPQNE